MPFDILTGLIDQTASITFIFKLAFCKSFSFSIHAYLPRVQRQQQFHQKFPLPNFAAQVLRDKPQDNKDGEFSMLCMVNSTKTPASFKNT